MTRASVFLAPVGTSPTAADAWTHVGYAEDVVLEVSEARPHPTTDQCPRTEAIEEPR